MRPHRSPRYRLRCYLTAIILLFFMPPLHTADQERASIPGRQSISVTSHPKNAALALTPDEQAWLVEHQEIVLGGSLDLPPLGFLDDKGVYRGFNIDLIEMINKTLGSQIKILPGKWAQLQQKARRGEIDGLVGPSITEERKHYLVFTEPYLTIPNVLFTRNDYPRLKRIEDFAGQTVAIHEGSSAIGFFEKNFPDIRMVLTQSHLESLLSVSIGETDAAYMSLSAGSYYASRNSIANLRAAVVGQGGDDDVRLGVRKDWPQLASILQKALDSLSTGQRTLLSRNWINSFEGREPGRITLTEQEQQWLQDHPVVRVVVDADQAPVEFRGESGQYQGISMEYLHRLEQLLGIHFEVADVPSWSDGLEEVRGKRLDMISSIASTEQRKQSFLFTAPINHMPVTIFARNDISYIGTLDNLAGKRVAVESVSPIGEWLARDYPKVITVPVASIPAGLKALSNGDVDAYVTNLVYTSYYAGKLGINNVRIAGETHYTHNQSMAVRNDWPVFAAILKKALDAISQRERDNFYNRWMSIRYEVETDHTFFWQVFGLGVLILALFFFWNRWLAREVSTRKKTEVALQAATEAANAANKAKSAFLANMSHEIRTPMNAIVGLTYLLEQTNPTPEQARWLNQIDTSAELLLSIINDILDLSKIESGKLVLEQSEFSLDEIVDTAQSMFSENIDTKGIVLEVDLDDVPNRLRGDLTRLRQALLNYIGNAVKFTEQGTICLRIKKLEEDGDEILLRFEVQDTGIGIAPDVLTNLFVAFEQADVSTTRKYGGTGLGLVITRRLAELMGGEAGATSEPGRGSTFWFTARLGIGVGSHVPAATTTAKDSRKKPHAPDCGSHILLVEDNAINRTVALAMMGGAGLVVETAANGREAVEMVRTNTYGLILMDVQMPVMSGLEATRIIRCMAGKQNLPILALTAAVFDADRQACLEAGMNDFITKPINVKAMFATISKWLPEMKPVEWVEASPDKSAITAGLGQG